MKAIGAEGLIVIFMGTNGANKKTINFLSNQLLQGYGVDQTVTDMLDKFDWYIVPVVNPDGYIYTWTTVSIFLKGVKWVPFTDHH